MNLQELLAVHNEFVRAATLPENTRPWSCQSNLESIQKLIMKEIEAHTATPPPQAPNLTDDIPF